jgi:hypothetical protein
MSLGGYGVLVVQNVRHAFLRNMIALHQWRHQRWYSTQRRGTAGENDGVWYLVVTSALVRLEIAEELEG